MKAIILAAGIGSRLRPITDTIPKCMVSVNNKMIIDNQIQGLINSGIEEIFVIGGYKFELLEQHLQIYPTVKLIHNNIYDSTNNMYSLFLSRNELKGEEFILLNADVFVDEKIIQQVCKTKIENAIVCDRRIFDVESMKIVKTDSIEEISKTITKAQAYAVSIDIYKFSEDTSHILFNTVEDYIITKKELNLWTEVALNDILSKSNFQPLEIQFPWVEIDNHEDLRIAEKLFC